jgi:hypothetical protein
MWFGLVDVQTWLRKLIAVHAYQYALRWLKFKAVGLKSRLLKGHIIGALNPLES